MSKKLFTLIELIVVIAILGTLAAIIIPNINNLKEDAIKSSILTDTKNIQTAITRYSIKNRNSLPVDELPDLQVPTKINYEKLIPNYLNKIPKSGFFWIDAYGNVWSSTIDAPTEYVNESGIIKWTKPEGKVSYYNIYGVNQLGSKVDYKMKKIATQSETTFDSTIYNYDIYLISAVDSLNLETVPIGEGYLGIKNTENKEQNNNPIIEKNSDEQSLIATNGYIRYDNNNPFIAKIESTEILNTDAYNNTLTKINTGNIKIQFTGTDLELLFKTGLGQTEDATISLDGINYSGINMSTPENGSQIIKFKINNLENKSHTVIIHRTNGYIGDIMLDAVDIVGTIEDAHNYNKTTTDAIPAMTSNVSSNGTLTVSSTYDSRWEAWKAFDDMIPTDSTYGWGNAGGRTGWIEYNFTNPKIIWNYTLMQSTKSPNDQFIPTSWTLEAWDGTKWIILDTQTNVLDWTIGEKKSFEFENATAYNRYKLNILNSGLNTSYNYIVIGEIEMMEKFLQE